MVLCFLLPGSETPDYESHACVTDEVVTGGGESVNGVIVSTAVVSVRKWICECL